MADYSGGCRPFLLLSAQSFLLPSKPDFSGVFLGKRRPDLRKVSARQSMEADLAGWKYCGKVPRVSEEKAAKLHIRISGKIHGRVMSRGDDSSSCHPAVLGILVLHSAVCAMDDASLRSDREYPLYNCAALQSSADHENPAETGEYERYSRGSIRVQHAFRFF